jgi:RNA polymerase sigma-32 factor
MGEGSLLRKRKNTLDCPDIDELVSAEITIPPPGDDMTHPDTPQSLTAWTRAETLPSPSNYEAYVAAAQRYPYLSPEEEGQLVGAWRDHQDREAARRLVLSHLRLVTRVVRDHAGYKMPPGDLAQEGTVGLMKAVQRFDPAHGVRLAAYALLWIQAEIREFILANWRMVRLSGASAKKLFFGYRKTQDQLRHLGTDRPSAVSPVQIADELGIPVHDVVASEGYFRGRDMGLAGALEEDGEQDVVLMDRALPGPDHGEEALHLQEPGQWLEAVDQTTHLQVLMKDAIGQLPARERDVLVARRLSDPVVGLQELGRRMNISAERVRQIENQAIGRMRRLMVEAMGKGERDLVVTGGLLE